MINNKKGGRLRSRCELGNRPPSMVVGQNGWSLRRLHTPSRLPAGRQPVSVFALRWLLMNILDVPALEAFPVLAVHVLGVVHVTLASGAFLELDHLTNSIHTSPVITGRISYIV